MSKWLSAKIQQLSNVEDDYFFKAIERMGYEADFSQKSLTRSMERDSQKVDCVLLEKATGNSAHIGLRFVANEDNTVNMVVVTDSYYSHVTDKKFAQNFTLEYNTVKYTDVAASMNFQVESEEILEDGRRKVVMTRCA